MSFVTPIRYDEFEHLFFDAEGHYVPMDDIAEAINGLVGDLANESERRQTAEHRLSASKDAAYRVVQQIAREKSKAD